MNPNMVARNRTARLVREANTPVYSTETKPVVREHLMAVELDSLYGRHWTIMPDSEVDGFIAAYVGGSDETELSDIDHAAKCWCFKA